MSLEFYLIRKYLRFDKTQPFISITAILAFIGVFVGVAILMISMSLMNGMSHEFQKRLFTMNYPLTVQSSVFSTIDDDVLDKLEQHFPNMQFSPYLKSNAIIKYGTEVSGIVLFGVDFERESMVNQVINDSLPSAPLGKFDILLGKGIYDNYLLFSGNQDLKSVQLIFTDRSPAGISLIPTMKKFKTGGVFNSGLTAYDKSYAYTTIESLQKIKQSKHYDGVHIYAKDPFTGKEQIKQAFPDLFTIGWWEQNGNFFEAQQLEKTALFIILMTIILIASLNIISSLLMTIMSRRKEIALLLSLGMSTKEVKKTFFLFGIILGGSGIVIGVVLGFAGMYILGNYDLIQLPADVYGTSQLPVRLGLQDFIYILLGSCGIVILSSIYPAIKASAMNAIEVLRFE